MFLSKPTDVMFQKWFSDDQRQNEQVKPSTKHDITEKGQEVGLFNLNLAIRKPQCTFEENGETETKRSTIVAYFETDPLNKFGTATAAWQKKYEFNFEELHDDGTVKLLLTLSLKDQVDIYNFFTSIDNGNLMYFQTQVPVAQLILRGECAGSDDQMPIDLITVEYANRVPSSK